MDMLKINGDMNVAQDCLNMRPDQAHLSALGPKTVDQEGLRQSCADGPGTKVIDDSPQTVQTFCPMP